MRDMTTRFRVYDERIRSWMDEGLIPACVWHNGYRYWKSDDINALIAGCPVNFAPAAASSIQKFSRRHFSLDLLPNAIAFAAAMITR